MEQQNIKKHLKKVAEIGVSSFLISTLVLTGCGGGGNSTSISSTNTPSTNTTASITPYKGQFSEGATVTIKDANGTPITLISGGTVNASGVANVSFSSTVIYPLMVEVTGTYYNEVTGANETTASPLRSVVANATAASSIPVTIVTETAVADLETQSGGSISSSNPMNAISAVAALSNAGTAWGVPASAIPTFNPVTHKSNDSHTIRISALAVVANSQAIGATLAEKVKNLAKTMASLNAASSPASVVTQSAVDNALTTMTTGTHNMLESGASAPAAQTMETRSIGTIKGVTAAANSTAATSSVPATPAASSVTPSTVASSVSPASAVSTVTTIGHNLFSAAPSVQTISGQVSVTLNDGSVFIANGTVANGTLWGTNLMTAQTYSPVTGNFSIVGNTKNNYGDTGTATLLQNGNVLLISGTGKAEIYNPINNTILPTGSMIAARSSSHTATLLQSGKVLIVGGSTNLSTSKAYVAAELYDPVTGSFSAAASMTTNRAHHTATLLQDGKVLIAGGNGGLGIKSAEIYDPFLNQFEPPITMKSNHSFHTATLLSDGSVLVAGGTDAFATVDSERYRPIANAFVSAGSMSVERSSHTATLLKDGRVLIVGGIGKAVNFNISLNLMQYGNVSVPIGEIYSLISDAYSTAGNQVYGQHGTGHTANLLANDLVLILGGNFVTSSPVNTSAPAEFYYP